jgi:hypothetical protein
MIEFENKYSPSRLQAKRMGYVFFQHLVFISIVLIGVKSQAQKSFVFNCYISDSIPISFQIKSEAETFMMNQLQLKLSQGFATAKWDLVDVDSILQIARYKLLPGKAFRYGEITNWNNEWMTSPTIQQLLYWHPQQLFTGIPFENSVFKNLESYGISIHSFQVFFSDSIANVRLDAQPISKNRFQGILGSQSNSGKTTILGEVEAQWVNHFKRAEKIYFHWQRQATAVQKMESTIHFPVLFRSAFGAQIGFDFYRNTQSFFQVSSSASLDYRWKIANTVSIWGQLKNHTQLSGENVAIQHQLVGVKLDQKLLQNDHWEIYTTVSYAQGKQKTTADYSLQKNNIQKSEIQLTLNKKNKTTYLHLQFHHAGIWAKKISAMEKIRLGGMSTMRGFAQESIYCDHYIAQQLQFGKNWSDHWNVFGFYDSGLIQNLQSKYWQGFGIGTQISSEAGTIEISNGWGIAAGQKFDLRNNVIHLGYQVYF